MVNVALLFGPSASPQSMNTYSQIDDSFALTLISSNPTIYFRQVPLPTTFLGRLLRDTPLQRAEPWLTLACPSMLARAFRPTSLGQFGIVHSLELDSPLTALALKLSKTLGFKHVITCWENIPFRLEGLPWRRKLIREVCASSAHFIAVTERARTTLILEGANPDRIVVIPPSLPKFKMGHPTSGVTSAGRGRKVRFLFAATRGRSKGLNELIMAASLLRAGKAESNFELIVVGQDPFVAPYLDRINQLQVRDCIRYLGRVSHQNMSDIYNQADVLVVPSRVHRLWQEQFGMVVLEARAQGLGIISSHSGSLSECAGAGAILCRPNDHDSLYRAMMSVVDDPELLRTMKTGSLQGLDEYDSGRVGDAISKLYGSII